ncbi:GNAT family N-acetyltransferase [Bacillus sp. V59.32b]|nr:GNAT family N-acetyltransferase [Bacillus sp. V59.32b]
MRKCKGETMNLLKYYSNDDSTREKLYLLFEKVFGIEAAILKDFHARGFWNPDYTPYTFFDGDKAVANVSMFAMPLLIEGKRIKGAGIQSVMTDPEYRGRGLMKQLFQLMLTELNKQVQVAFLYTDKPDLYTAFGFRVIQEHYYTAAASTVAVEKKRPFRKLDFFDENDVEVLRNLFQTREPTSHQFFPLSYDSSFYLNMYNPYFHGKLHYCEELETVIVAEINGEA